MPLYDYRCTACAREVEVMHGIDAPGPDACEACGGPMSKLLSSPAIHFKGSGWAKKDAAAASATTAKTKPKTGSASDGGSSSTSGDGAATGKDGGESSASAAASKAEPSTSTSTTSD